MEGDGRTKRVPLTYFFPLLSQDFTLAGRKGGEGDKGISGWMRWRGGGRGGGSRGGRQRVRVSGDVKGWR